MSEDELTDAQIAFGILDEEAMQVIANQVIGLSVALQEQAIKAFGQEAARLNYGEEATRIWVTAWKESQLSQWLAQEESNE